MSLQLSPASFKQLNALITHYNLVPENDDIQRLFYLQKINTELSKTELNDELFDWLYDTTPESWHHQLTAYGVNPDASFFLKNIQFAQAGAKHSGKITKKLSYKNEYDLLQQRDLFLGKESFEEVREDYSAFCTALSKLASENNHISTMAKRQIQILEASKAKFAAIRVEDAEASTPTHVRYKTHELGTHVNNFNFKFTMTGWDEPFVFRVEDRDDLWLEQHLYSHPVSKYFAEDLGGFMWGFLNEKKLIEYKPVFLSQFAKQGNLTDIATSLRNTNPKNFAAITSHYFDQLINLSIELINAKVYHPDIKLTNF